jgi:acyl homoserine lactone synthase
MVVTPDRYDACATQLVEMHRLRKRVFWDRMGWEVRIAGDLEADDFDLLMPTYLLAIDDGSGRVVGCLRLLPTTGPNMLRDTFPILLGGRPAISDKSIPESSRFAVDTSSEGVTKAIITRATQELFLGLIEYGLDRGYSHIMTVCDVLMERIVVRGGWKWTRLCEPAQLGKERAVAGLGVVSVEALETMRARGHRRKRDRSRELGRDTCQSESIDRSLNRADASFVTSSNETWKATAVSGAPLLPPAAATRPIRARSSCRVVPWRSPAVRC